MVAPVVATDAAISVRRSSVSFPPRGRAYALTSHAGSATSNATGRFSLAAPFEPWNRASPNGNMPPSAATTQ